MDTVDPWKILRMPDFVRSLASYIDFDDLALSLASNDILPTAAINDIQGKVQLHERNQCLLQWLSKEEPAKYDVFVYLLYEKKMLDAVRLLQNGVVNDPLGLPRAPQASRPNRGLRAFGGGSARVPDGCAGADSGAHRTVGEANGVEQQVIKATDLQKGEDIYPMLRCSRGKCIIINNRDFGGIFQTRHGSDVDVHRMRRLFSALLFECVVHRNLEAKVSLCSNGQ